MKEGGSSQDFPVYGYKTPLDSFIDYSAAAGGHGVLPTILRSHPTFNSSSRTRPPE